MSLLQWIVIAVALQRLGELVLSHRNGAKLRAKGGVEVGSGHYPLMVALHAGWLVALFFATPTDATVSWLLLTVFLLLQTGRIWVIPTLGERWTTRIISLPNAPLIRRGPYRWLNHPNYLIVIAEIAVLPLAFGQWKLALGFSLANLLVLYWRVWVENTALNSPLKKASLTGFHATAKHIAAKAVSPSSETMRTI